jgi:hypothetical protein
VCLYSSSWLWQPWVWPPRRRSRRQPKTQQNPRDRFVSALANRLGVSVDRLNEAIKEARQDVGANQPVDRRGPRGFVGPGRDFGLRGFLGREMQAVATLFNITPEQLRSELPGATLEELATRHGKSAQDVVNTIVATANQDIDRIAQARNVPADRVSQMKQQISERAQQFVTTHRFPARGSGTRS